MFGVGVGIRAQLGAVVHKIVLEDGHLAEGGLHFDLMGHHVLLLWR